MKSFKIFHPYEVLVCTVRHMPVQPECTACATGIMMSLRRSDSESPIAVPIGERPSHLTLHEKERAGLNRGGYSRHIGRRLGPGAGTSPFKFTQAGRSGKFNLNLTAEVSSSSTTTTSGPWRRSASLSRSLPLAVASRMPVNHHPPPAGRDGDVHWHFKLPVPVIPVTASGSAKAAASGGASLSSPLQVQLEIVVVALRSTVTSIDSRLFQVNTVTQALRCGPRLVPLSLRLLPVTWQLEFKSVCQCVPLPVAAQMRRSCVTSASESFMI